MSRLTKIMLELTIINSVASVLFLTGVVDVSALPGLYVVFPLAAVAYGMFLICHALDKEVGGFDAEQHAHHDHTRPGNHSESAEIIHGHG
jgi:hypothetical protein